MRLNDDLVVFDSMWTVDLSVDTNLSEKYSVSSFTTSSTEKAAHADEYTVRKYVTSLRRQNPEKRHHNHRRKNLRCHILSEWCFKYKIYLESQKMAK